MPGSAVTRARALARRAAVRALAAVADPPPPAPPAPPPPTARQFARTVPVGALALEEPLATSRLVERLAPADVAEIERRLGEHEQMRRAYAAATPALRGHLLLHLGMHLLVPAVYEKTGLRLGNPPQEVHAMARGPLAEAGGLYEADLVASALASVGDDVADVGAALDFGCSSGRVVRVLDAAWPEVDWHGCDPNGEAIAWAGSHLHGIGFTRSGDAPPLAFGDGAFGLVYAISIWSHFAPALGLRWLDEMHRLLRPGGKLVMTTHGLASVAYYASIGERTPEQCEQIVEALYRDGWWYKAEFGDDGDWGVVNPDWGTAFLTPEWLLAQLTPRWRVLEFAVARNGDNQDVYVLERV